MSCDRGTRWGSGTTARRRATRTGICLLVFLSALMLPPSGIGRADHAG